ncbi:hypothetical protein N9L48_06060, partial [Psychrosphaera sp.]|nr:hypothetical protein [Psychrosphaera sp.]
MFLNAFNADAEPSSIGRNWDVASESTVLLRTPPPHSQGYFVSEVLTKLYDKLGYKVEFMNVPSVRELELASRSVLSGVLARDQVIEQSYPDLVRVDFSLFEYQVILTGDRRSCGYCLPEDITMLGYPKGLKVFPTIIEKHFNKPTVIPLTDTAKVEEVVLKQRLPAFLNANIDYSEQLKLSPHSIKHVLDTRPDFHYLSPKFAFLKPALEQALKQMLESGELDSLKKKYGIQSFPKTGKPIKQRNVKVVSGTWQEYTESDGTGVYWEILESGL